MDYNPHKRTRCRRCGKHWSQVGAISWGGNCEGCGNRAALANAAAMREHRGEFFDHWRRRCLAAFGIDLDGAPPGE